MKPKQLLRTFGIQLGIPGSDIIKKLIVKRLEVDDLTYKEVKEVLYAWDTRNFVPECKKNMVDHVYPEITQEEVEQGIFTQEERDRDYVENIVKYLSTVRFDNEAGA